MWSPFLIKQIKQPAKWRRVCMPIMFGSHVETTCIHMTPQCFERTVTRLHDVRDGGHEDHLVCTRGFRWGKSDVCLYSRSRRTGGWEAGTGVGSRIDPRDRRPDAGDTCTRSPSLPGIDTRSASRPKPWYKSPARTSSQ